MSEDFHKTERVRIERRKGISLVALLAFALLFACTQEEKLDLVRVN